MRRLTLLLFLLLGLAACAADPVWAPDEDVERARVSTSNPPTLSLVSVIAIDSGNGVHSALMIDGAERVVFDPSGSFYHPNLPERNDVVFGMTDRAVDFFMDFYARKSFKVVRQDLVVPAEIAAQAMAEAKAYGAVPNAYCANSVSTLLRRLPGFEKIRVTMYPDVLMDQFAKIQGVVTREYHDDDQDFDGVKVVRGI